MTSDNYLQLITELTWQNNWVLTITEQHLSVTVGYKTFTYDYRFDDRNICIENAVKYLLREIYKYMGQNIVPFPPTGHYGP